jgi:hypothetical protein
MEKGIPILSGETAERFIKIAENNELLKNSIDFSKQIKEKQKIISKSKIEPDFMFWDEMWNNKPTQND